MKEIGFSLDKWLKVADEKLCRHFNWWLTILTDRFSHFQQSLLFFSLPHKCSLCYIHCCFVSVMAAGWSPCGHWRIYGFVFLRCRKNTRITYSHSSHITGCASFNGGLRYSLSKDLPRLVDREADRFVLCRPRKGNGLDTSCHRSENGFCQRLLNALTTVSVTFSYTVNDTMKPKWSTETKLGWNSTLASAVTHGLL